MSPVGRHGRCRRARAPRGRGPWSPALLLVLLVQPATSLASHSAVRPPPPTPCRDANLAPTHADLARINAAALCLLNRIRVANHLRTLRLNRELQGVASGQAHDMVAGDYFGDNSRAGLTPMQRILATGYPRRARRVLSAQNIGWATGPLATPSGIVRAWMHSPPHRAIILTASYRDVGVGVTAATPRSLSGGRAGATYTLEFGQRVF